MNNSKKFRHGQGKSEQFDRNRPHSSASAEESKIFPLPAKVSAEVERMLDKNKISNWGLLFHRYLSYYPGWKLEGKDKKNKFRTWKGIADASKQVYQNSTMENALEVLRRRAKKLEQGCAGQPVVSFQATVNWRLSIGFGTPSVLDTGMALHRIYGIPYLPGSAIKGLTRRFCFSKISEELGVFPLPPGEIKTRHEAHPRQKTPWEKLEDLLIADEPASMEEAKRLQNLFDDLVKNLSSDSQLKKPEASCTWLREKYRDFRRAFGATDGRGEVTFFDGFPVLLRIQKDGKEVSILELDIINTHYQKYYTGDAKVAPADYLNPNPVYFLTVRQGTPFRFLLAGKDGTLLGTVASWLREAVQQFGIGAKTSAGYGEMEPLSEVNSPRNPE